MTEERKVYGFTEVYSANGIRITADDPTYQHIANQMSKALARSMQHTKEALAARLFAVDLDSIENPEEAHTRARWGE